MEQDFTEIMSTRTDEELIEIIKVKRGDYQHEAVQADERELELRRVDLDQIDQVMEVLTERENMKMEFDSSKVNSWTRLIHFFVDSIGFLLTLAILSLVADFFIPTLNEAFSNFLVLLLLLTSFFLYFVFLEYKYQKTIGKFLTKTKVVLSDGQKPELRDIFIRTAYRFIPFDPFSFLFTSNGFHDRFSNTTVIREEK